MNVHNEQTIIRDNKYSSYHSYHIFSQVGRGGPPFHILSPCCLGRPPVTSSLGHHLKHFRNFENARSPRINQALYPLLIFVDFIDILQKKTRIELGCDSHLACMIESVAPNTRTAARPAQICVGAESLLLGFSTLREPLLLEDSIERKGYSRHADPIQGLTITTTCHIWADCWVQYLSYVVE
jgi:hypothetical protein